MKKNLIILFFAVSILLYCIYYENEREKEKLEQHTFIVQSSIFEKNKVINKFKYYDDNNNIIKIESFSSSGDISYSSIYDNYIYSYGPGGLYKTDVIKKNTEKMSNEDINIVRSYKDDLYYYVNEGFEDNGYKSKICSKSNCIDLNIAVNDFYIYENLIYVLGENSILIYKNNLQIANIDISKLNIYNKILTNDEKVFVLNNDNIYEVVLDKIILFKRNNIIKDYNFKIYLIDKKIYCFDRVLRKISILTIEDSEIREKIIFKNCEGYTTKEFLNDDIIIYHNDYKNNIIYFENVLSPKKSRLKAKVENNEDIFNAYIISEN